MYIMDTEMNSTLNKCEYSTSKNTSLMSHSIKGNNVCFKVNSRYKTNFVASNNSSISIWIRREAV